MRWTIQIALLAGLFAFCLMQLPVGALFFSPRTVSPTAPVGAAFVELDEAVYQQMLRQAHELGWSRRAQSWMDEKGGGAEARVLDDSVQPPEPLPLPAAFRRTMPVLTAPPSRPPVASLRPESLAAPELTALPASAVAPADVVVDDMLDLDSYETLQERK